MSKCWQVLVYLELTYVIPSRKAVCRPDRDQSVWGSQHPQNPFELKSVKLVMPRPVLTSTGLPTTVDYHLQLP